MAQLKSGAYTNEFKSMHKVREIKPSLTLKEKEARTKKRAANKIRKAFKAKRKELRLRKQMDGRRPYVDALNFRLPGSFESSFK